jgi:hypothetical protein
MKRKLIQFKATEEFKKEVQKAASEDNKTLTGYITECLLLDLKKRRKKV